MLRLAVARGGNGVRAGASRQWQPPRLVHPRLIRRSYAVVPPTPDKVVLPGSRSDTAVGVPHPPALKSTTTTTTTANSFITPEQSPLTPPTPAEVKATLPASADPPPPKKKKGRFSRFLLTLIVLSALGYGGGVYYSLVNDNFHDFFTEHVPLGEDAVAYFEEREFRKRFPNSSASSSRSWPQTRGENKVTIGRQSGISPRVAETENGGSDFVSRGRHTSALADNDAKSAPTLEPTQQTTNSNTKQAKTSTSSKTAEKAGGGEAVSTIDHVNAPEAQEPAVQEAIKLVNGIIAAINNTPDASKYASILAEAKNHLNTVIGEIKLAKEKAFHDAQTEIQNAHLEFDQAAKELVRRLEDEMRDQEARWRDEYEQEREKLNSSYQKKLSAELEATRKVYEQKKQNELIAQEIALQRKFMESVRAKVEEERSGRLSKLDELSGSVAELEKLTSEWNSVVDATLQTQHLQVALQAVRAKIQESDRPTPFINELVTLKEVSKNNDVVNAAIASINPAAYQRGVPSTAHLIDRFRRVASEVRKASLLPEDAGVASHAASAVLSKLMFQKKADRGLPEGDDVEATLARTEVLLEEGDLDAATREMNGLKGWASVLSRDWVGECRRVLEVRQAVEVIAAESRLQSLLVR